MRQRDQEAPLGDSADESMRRLRAFSTAAAAITSELAIGKVLQKIIDTARELLHARYAALGVTDEERRKLTAFVVSGLTQQEIEAIGPRPRGLGLLGELLREPRPIRVKNIAKDPRSIGFPKRHPSMTSFLGVPIVSRGRVFGNFYIADKIGADEFTQDDEDILVIFAAHAAVAIENARLYSETSVELQNRVRQLERAAGHSAFLAELGTLLPSGPASTILPLEKVAERLTAHLADACGIFLVEERDATVIASKSMYHSDPARAKEAEQVVEAAWPRLEELVATSRQAIVAKLTDGSASASGAISIPAPDRHRFGGILAAPIVTGDKFYGLLVSLSSQPLELTDEDLRFASLVSDRLAIAIENSRLYADMARLAAIVESSYDAICGRTLDGILTSWNPAAERLYGYEAEEVIGKSFSLIFPSERRDELQEILGKTMAGQRIERFETVRVRKDGSRVDVSLTMSPIKDAAGRIIGVSTIARDITGQKRAERALRDSEAKYRAVFRAVAAGLWVTDADALIVEVNDAALEAAAMTRDQVIGGNLADPRWEAVDENGSPVPVEAYPIVIALRTGRPVHGLVVNWLRADGQRIWSLVNAEPITDANGKVTGGVVTTFDITGRKSMEEDLLKARDELQLRVYERTAELQSANEQLQKLNQELIQASNQARAQADMAWRRASELEATIENIADGVFICDDKGQIVGVNEAGLRLIGLTKKEDALRPLAEYLALLNLRNPEGSPITAEELALSRALHGEIVVGSEEVATSLQAKRDINLLVSAAPIRDREGSSIGAVAVLSDITQIRDLDKLKDQFIAVAAHELKTPVAIMKGYAQSILMAPETLSPTSRKMLEAINRGSDRIDRIVKDLLDISRLRLGRLELAKQKIDLPEMVEDVVERRALIAIKNSIRVVRADPVIVEADRDRLEQVLVNLLNNAITYSPKGGDIDVAVAVREREAVVSVKDYGEGIPEGKKERVFERFYRAHAGTRYDYGGMGVGLYISREIISRHGGRMWFESVEGEGSTFYFSIPV